MLLPFSYAYIMEKEKKNATHSGVTLTTTDLHAVNTHIHTFFLFFEVELYTLHADDVMCDNSLSEPDNMEKDFKDIQSYRFLDCRVDR